MNIKFNLEGIKVNVPGQEVDIEIGKLSYEVEELSMIESLNVMKEMPSIIREVRKAIEEPLTTDDGIGHVTNATQPLDAEAQAELNVWLQSQQDKEAEAHSRAVQYAEEEGASKSYVAGAKLARRGADTDGDNPLDGQGTMSDNAHRKVQTHLNNGEDDSVIACR